MSFNTEFTTIKWLSEEAVKQEKIHRIIIMIELGDLREGILGEHLMAFYKKIFDSNQLLKVHAIKRLILFPCSIPTILTFVTANLLSVFWIV